MRNVFTLLGTLFLASCGAAYFSPDVIEETTASGVVTVAEITANSVSTANNVTYSPKSLPAIFSQTTGGASGIRGAGALPDPAFQPENRPASMVTRLPPNVENGTYKIGSGDVLLLATPNASGTVAELTGLLAAQSRRQGYTVQDDGMIALPDIGRVSVAGLTLEEAEAVLFKTLVENQIDPSFSLEIAEFNSQRVSIGGAVRTPTILPITLSPIHLDEALNLAGGISATDTAFVSIRLYRDGTMYQIPMQSYLDKTDIQKTVLHAGDNLFVDTTFDVAKAHAYFEEQIRLVEFRQTARATALAQLNAEVTLRRAQLAEARTNFQTRIDLDAVERDYVYLSGEVGVQGRYTLPFGRTANLSDALFDSAQGVPTETGNIAEIYVLRGTRDGTGVTAWHLDARNVANLILATRFELRPNDIIFIAEQPVTRWGRVVSQLSPTLITEVTKNW